MGKMNLRMRDAVICFLGLGTAALVLAQAPVENLSKREAAIQRSQHEAGRAFSLLRQAQHEAKLAEQDHLNAQEAYRAAQRQAEERQREVEATRKTLESAKAKEAKARQTYEAALKAVDEAWKQPPAKKQ